MRVDRPTIRQIDKAANDHHLDEICSPAVCIAHVAFPVTVIVYSLVFT